jgi:hypothetical protein
MAFSLIAQMVKTKMSGFASIGKQPVAMMMCTEGAAMMSHPALSV